MIFRGLCILASWLAVASSLNRDEEPNPATGVQRQFIGSQGFGQNPFSRAPPFSMPSNGMNPIGGMNDPQPSANQVQLLAAMQKDPRMRQQMSGFLQQMEGGGGGIGQPMGENGFRNEESTLMQNPITAPEGLTKDVLKSLMLGNVGEMSPPYGNRMGFPSNDMINSFSNGPSSPPDGPRKLGSLVNSFTNRQSDSEGFPAFPKFNFGGQEQSQEESMLHARHHHRHGHSKKGKSDTVTKLLLSLLVDKLKDIYEMDKFNTSTVAQKHNVQNLETTGKIGNDLHSAVDQGNNQTQEAADQRDHQRKGTFQTNLTFPLTVSDQKSTGVQLIDSDKEGAKADNESNFEVDSATIDKIIKGIEANKTLKLNPARSKPVVKTGINRELKEINNIDAGSLSTSETAEKSTKVLGNEDFIKYPDTGSFAEFHTIKMPLKSANQNESISSPDEQPAKAEDIEALVPSDGNGVENITSLPSFSVSSFLNRDKSQSVRTATDRVLAPDLQSSQGISSTELDSAPNDLSSKLEDSTSELRKPGSDNYLEASRVLGSVYNKVTDPLAKKSVETAIKAMLKLIRSDSSYSKKGNVPSLESGTDCQRGETGLERSFNAFVGREDGAVKKGRRVTTETFPLKTLIRKTEQRVRKKIITRSKFKESQTKQLNNLERICKCERKLARILKRTRKSVNKGNSKLKH